MVCEESVTIPACEPVSEIARCPRSLIAIAQSAHEIRSPTDSSMSSSRGSGRSETSSAISTSSSVVFPRADSTATTRCPPSRAATIRRAARRMSSASATEVPPNFITTISGSGPVLMRAPEDSRGPIRAPGGASPSAAPYRGAMPPPPVVARRRQAIAILLAVAATAAIWLLFLRSGDSSDRASRSGGAADAKPQVARVESQLSLPEMVDQVMLIGFDGRSPSGRIRTELRSHQVGGVLVGPANWPGASAGQALTGGLRADGLAGGRVAPLIVAQQEGGAYRSFGDLPPAQTQLEIAAPGSSGAVERWARETGAALRGHGFDLNLFPIADLSGATSPVRDRGFAADPQAAAALTAAAIRGCAAARIVCAPAHFPGLGDASQDTDQGPATVASDPQSLADRALPAFRAAFAAKADAVVLSLAFYAAYDPVTPAALAEPVATGLLRGELHFRGAAITDDLEAGAIRATMSVPEAAVEAIAAGSDMVQVSSARDVEAVRAALLHAVESGQVTHERLADAAARVLELKRRVGLLRGR